MLTALSFSLIIIIIINSIAVLLLILAVAVAVFIFIIRDMIMTLTDDVADGDHHRSTDDVADDDHHRISCFLYYYSPRASIERFCSFVLLLS